MNRKMRIQSYLRFWCHLLLGMYHGISSFLIAYFGCSNVIYKDGYPISREEFGIIVYQSIVTIVNLRIAYMSTNWHWLNHLFIWASILVYPLSLVIIDAMKMSPIMRGLTTPLMRTSSYWFITIASAITGMIPVVVHKAIVLTRDVLTNRIIFFERKNKQALINELETDNPQDEDNMENL